MVFKWRSLANIKQQHKKIFNTIEERSGFPIPGLVPSDVYIFIFLFLYLYKATQMHVCSVKMESPCSQNASFITSKISWDLQCCQLLSKYGSFILIPLLLVLKSVMTIRVRKFISTFFWRFPVLLYSSNSFILVNFFIKVLV